MNQDVNDVAAILIHVQNTKEAFELLLYTYQNQMHLGQEYLSLMIKHDDGLLEKCKGSIDHVFKSEIVRDIEIEDLILLEHSDIISETAITDLSCSSVDELIRSVQNTNQCCGFIFPPNTNKVFFAIKDHPMARYTLRNNEVISDLTYGNKSSIINNMCGELNTRQGLALMKTTN